MMNFEFLPSRIRTAICDNDISSLSEMRLRIGFPIFCVNNGKTYYFKDGKMVTGFRFSEVCTKSDITEIIEKVTEKSLYAFHERIKQGYLTTKDGIRIGLAGECVVDKGSVLTIREISSLNIRVPHEISGCSDLIYEKIFKEDIFNTLIVSPPSKGKTTILKDLIRKFDQNKGKQILVIDERGEFCSIRGKNIDAVKFCDKNFALKYALRSMSPEVVFTDELQTENDWKCAKNAVFGGVKLIASCHGKNIEDLKNKEFFDKNVFERYVFLDENKSAGTLKSIYNGDFTEI